MSSTTYTTSTERPEDAAAIERICDDSFGGPERLTKRSYAYRQGVAPVDYLSFVVRDAAERPIATIRYWPVLVGGAPALLLGPLAVRPDHQGLGHGRWLVRHTLDIAAWANHDLVLLVGDPGYYRRLGFEPAWPYGIAMPFEDADRLLVNWLQPDRRPAIRGLVTRLPAGEDDCPSDAEGDRWRGPSRPGGAPRRAARLAHL
ncbi:MAG: N-acetyltransferase [Azospirillaceae bacterium]